MIVPRRFAPRVARSVPLSNCRTALASALAAGFASCALAQTTGPSTTLPTVTVTATPDSGESLQQLSRRLEGGALGGRTQLDTPFSTTIVPHAEIEGRPVDRLGDVFALDSAVSDNSAASGAWATYLTVRGLPLDWQNGFRIDGNPFISYTTTLPFEQLEQVELLKGSTGFLYGFGSPGGVVNYITRKPPTSGPIRSVTAGYGPGSLWRGQIDLGARVGVDEMFGYRLNATHEEGRTINEGSLKRDSLSLALDAWLTNALTWDFQAINQDRDVVGQEPTIETSMLTSGLPRPVSAANKDIVGAGSFVDTSFRYYATGLRYELTPGWTLSGRYSHNTSEARRNETILYLRDSAGNYDDWRSDFGEHYQFNRSQVLLEGDFGAAGLRHHLVAGLDSQNNKNDYSTSSVYQQIGTGSLYAPNSNSFYSTGGIDSLALARSAEIRQQSVFVSDTIKFSERWSAIAGLRGIRYREAVSGYAKSVTTPTVALMFQPAPRTLAYASYVESLEPGSVVGTQYANRGQVLAPLGSRQIEIGVKTDQQRWAATAAVFRIRRGAESVNAANELVQGGESMYRGLELAGLTRWGKSFEIGGSVMLLDSEYGAGFPNPGNRVVGAPQSVATLYTSYRLPQLPALKLRADAKYTGSTMLRSTNDLEVPSFTVLNLGATYDTQIGGHDTSFRLAVRNALDKRYWLFQYNNYVKAGDPRGVMLSATVSF